MADEEPKTKNHREVVRKENYFSIGVVAGEKYTVAIDGVIVINTIMGDDCTASTYMKRASIPMQYKD